MNGDFARKVALIAGLIANTAALIGTAVSQIANKAAIEEAVDKRFKEYENKTEE